MKTRHIALPATAVLAIGLLAATVSASGQAAVIGVIERVVLEPSAEAPERVQIWGAFTIAEHMPGQGLTGYTGERARGYLYFKLSTDQANAENAKREWADLKSVAGTKQAVAFAYWDRVRGDKLMRIRTAGTPPADPDIYRTDIGVTKLSATGSFGAVIGELVKLTDR
jgi:hypothetical protein